MARITNERASAHDALARRIVDGIRSVYTRRAEDWRRDHLGASIIGHDCDRHLWLSFRWAQAPNHDGKQLRLFERGKREEEWIIEDLRAAGLTVRNRDDDGAQFRVTLGTTGHAGGSMDGIIEIDGVEYLAEIKTHNGKSFDRLVEKGVRQAKPEHFAQMQAYMADAGLGAAVYIAVCKDDDRMYVEIVDSDVTFALRLAKRADAIVRATEPPPRELDAQHPPCLYTSADGKLWPCQHYALCHGAALPERNCRTCAYSETRDGGEWHCLRFGEQLDSSKQREGCAAWVPIPATINAQVVDATEDWVKFQFGDGKVVTLP